MKSFVKAWILLLEMVKGKNHLIFCKEKMEEVCSGKKGSESSTDFLIEKRRGSQTSEPCADT